MSSYSGLLWNTDQNIEWVTVWIIISESEVYAQLYCSDSKPSLILIIVLFYIE